MEQDSEHGDDARMRAMRAKRTHAEHNGAGWPCTKADVPIYHDYGTKAYMIQVITESPVRVYSKGRRTVGRFILSLIYHA